MLILTVTPNHPRPRPRLQHAIQRALNVSSGKNKLFRLSEGTVLASTGCWGDTGPDQPGQGAHANVQGSAPEDMTTPAVAQMLSILMYNRRFFPYYASNVLARLDEEGRGVVYSYDPIGDCKKTTYRARNRSGYKCASEFGRR
ncbi:hypothetical protein quinque_008271 [Culex quinquefasciatus]|uniref:Uncharacterized protein n=1 Tax=Culex pipiens pipiens TaxID=38569 RepID=A0ABD1CHY6_CULPP